MPIATEETFCIRRLTLKDVLEGKFLNVLAELTTVHSPESPQSKESLTKRFESMNPALHHIFVLVRSSDDRVVGAGTLLIWDVAALITSRMSWSQGTPEGVALGRC